LGCAYNLYLGPFAVGSALAISVVAGIDNRRLEYGVKDSRTLKRFSAAEIVARQQAIGDRPPRLAALPAAERTHRQQLLLDEMGVLVIDGVRKPREDTASLEILIRHAELYAAHLEVAKRYLSDCEMSIRDRELAILRVAWLSQAPFEWGAHVKIAKRNGISAGEIESVIEGAAAPSWSERDRAILQAIEELHFDSMICDDTWVGLQQFFGDKKLIELLILAGQYKTVAYYQNSLRLPLPDGNKGLLAR
jgi:alkylhydroperoxidase family enzyme